MAALKPEFVASLPAELAELADALSSEPSPVSILVNRAKGYVPPADAEPVAWNADGYYLPSRPQFTLDPALHQGRYYVQDASSMIVGAIVRRLTSGASAPVRYLDACAAPGGKTIGALSLLPAGSLVVANEYVGRRASILAENLAKWGATHAVVTNDDTARFARLPHFFDIVAADVPCSGEGMMRKDQEAADQWSPQLVDQCALRQREIVTNLWDTLRPGGYFIYSTCTFNRAENEDIVHYMVTALGAESIPTGLDGLHGIGAGIATPHHCLRMTPGRVRGEGLFAAVLRKPDAPRCCKPLKPAPKSAAVREVTPWLKGDWHLSQHSDSVVAVPAAIADDVHALRQALNVIAAGVRIATIKGRDLIPAQELLLSDALRPGAFPTAEVDLPTAFAYLRRQAVTLPPDAPHGLVALTYQSHPLGMVKNLGSRANNLYPMPWRILK